MQIADKRRYDQKISASEDLTEVSDTHFVDIVDSAINVQAKYFRAFTSFFENCTTSSTGAGIRHELSSEYTSNVSRCCFKRDLAPNWGSAYSIANSNSRNISTEIEIDLVTVYDCSDLDDVQGMYVTVTMTGYQMLREINISDCHTMKELASDWTCGCSLRFAPGNTEKESIFKFSIIKNAAANVTIMTIGIGDSYTYPCTVSDVLLVNNTAQYSAKNFDGETIIANSTFVKSPISFYSQGTNYLVIAYCSFDEEPSLLMKANISEYFSANQDVVAIAEERVKWTICRAGKSGRTRLSLGLLRPKIMR